MSERDHANLCANQTIATRALIDALGKNPATALDLLYQPHDPIDGQAKDSLLTIVKKWSVQLPPAISPMRNETTAAGCEWVMSVQLLGRNVLRLPRQTKPQGTLRMILETDVERGQKVKRIFGFTGF
jgi:hypothetical protein